VQAVLSSGANAVYEAVGTADAIGLAATLHPGGFKGMIINRVTYLPGSLASSPSNESALQGVYVADTFPANQNNAPAARRARSSGRGRFRKSPAEAIFVLPSAVHLLSDGILRRITWRL